MKFLSRTALRNYVFVGGALFLCLTYLIGDGFSNSGGIVGVTNNPNVDFPGCTCHNPTPNSNTSVWITSDAPEFAPGQKYRFKIWIANENMEAAGVNISKFRTRDTSSRLDTVLGQGMRKTTQQLTHRFPKPVAEGLVTYEFDYTTATTGSDTIYAVANAVNDNGSAEPGDQWNFAAKFPIDFGVRSVALKPEIADGFTISPNPARNFVRLQYMMKKPVDLRIMLVDVAGREALVRQTNVLGTGKGETMLDLGNLPSGDYFVHVTSGGALLYTGKISRLK